MEEKYNWNLKEIFASKEDFEKTKMEMLEELEEISKFKGNLCESSNSLYQCYKIYETALEKLERLYAYGMLKYHLDMSNQEGIKLFKEVESISTEFATKTSFITPELIYTDTEVIEK